MTYFKKAKSRIGTNCKKWDRYDSKDYIPLWIADMDFECTPEVKESIIHRANHGLFGYTDPSEEAYQAILDFEKRHHHLSLKKEEIVFCTGIVYALSTAVELLCDKEEKVLVQPPVYPPFFNVPLSLNREVIFNPLITSPEVKVNLQEMEELLKNDPKIKLLIFCNPQNPLGKCWSKKELEEILQLAEKYNLIVISDEIHADLVLKPHQHVSMLAINEKYNSRIIHFGAPTKTFNLAGINVAYAIIPNEEIRARFAQSAKASGLSSINIFGYEALTAAYNHGDAWLEECLQTIQENMLWLDCFLKANLPLCKFKIPEATYLAWVDFSAYSVPDNFKELLKSEVKVELQDGRGFKESQGYQRINVACPLSTLQEGMNRILTYMRKNGYL